MNKTKRKKKEIQHYELESRMNMRDMMDFAFFLVDSELYSMKSYRHHVIRIVLVCVLYPIILGTVIGADIMFDSEPLRIALSVIFGFGLVRLLMNIKSPYPSISGVEASCAVADSTVTRGGKLPRKVFFNLGTKGFSTDAIKKLGITFYNYRSFVRVIECEHGIIMILDKSQILCIPARSFNDDSACFMIDRLKKKCGKRFMTMGKMKIEKADDSLFPQCDS